MTCENMFCIYQDLECEECTLEEISLDHTGTLYKYRRVRAPKAKR
ncbi:MAG: hypothetical protein R3Y29_02975 [bacterium]